MQYASEPGLRDEHGVLEGVMDLRKEYDLGIESTRETGGDLMKPKS